MFFSTCARNFSELGSEPEVLGLELEKLEVRTRSSGDDAKLEVRTLPETPMDGIFMSSLSDFLFLGFSGLLGHEETSIWGAK